MRASRNLLMQGGALFLLTVISACGPLGHAQNPSGAGIVVDGSAHAGDVGLPLYPGSVPHKDDQNSGSANLGLWGGGNGFKMAVLTMESGDALDKVAAFYRNALARYGQVLDCSDPRTRAHSSDKVTAPGACNSEPPEKGTLEYRVGTDNNFHLVAIRMQANKTVYSLVRMSIWEKPD